MTAPRFQLGRAHLVVAVMLAALASGCGDPFTVVPGGDAGVESCRHEFSDDFEREALGDAWQPVGDGATVTAGTLNIAPTATGSHGARSGPYDYRGCALRFEVVGVHNKDEQVQTSVALWQNARYVQFRLGPGHQLGMLAQQDASSLVSTAVRYDPVEHRFWGWRFSGGQVAFETSADGISWTERASGQAPSIVADEFVTFALNVADATNPGVAVFDNVTLGSP